MTKAMLYFKDKLVIIFTAESIKTDQPMFGILHDFDELFVFLRNEDGEVHSAIKIRDIVSIDVLPDEEQTDIPSTPVIPGSPDGTLKN